MAYPISCAAYPERGQPIYFRQFAFLKSKSPTCQPYVVRWWPPDVSTGGKGSRQVNKFEHAFSGRGECLYSEVQCVIGNGHIGPPHGQNDWQTDTYENITFAIPLAGGNNEMLNNGEVYFGEMSCLYQNP